LDEIVFYGLIKFHEDKKENKKNDKVINGNP